MRRPDDATDADEPDPARTLDLSAVPARQLRDRLDAHRDGREEQVVAAAAELRSSLDRLAAGLAARRAMVAARAGEMARAAAPFAGGLLAAGLGTALAVRRVRRPRPTGRPTGGSRTGG